MVLQHSKDRFHTGQKHFLLNRNANRQFKSFLHPRALNGNRMSRLTPLQLSGLSELVELDVSYNKLDSVEEILSVLPSLTQLWVYS